MPAGVSARPASLVVFDGEPVTVRFAEEVPPLLGKIAAAKALGKRVDGHAPGLRGDEARRYASFVRELAQTFQSLWTYSFIAIFGGVTWLVALTVVLFGFQYYCIVKFEEKLPRDWQE